MKDFTDVCERLQSIFHQELQIDPPAFSDDLVEAGILDSMMFVTLLMHLEEEFGARIAIQDIEMSDFSTISKIAKLVTTIASQHAA